MSKSIVLIAFLVIAVNQFITAQKRLIGFQNSVYFDEQILEFEFNPEVKVHINASSPETFDPNKPVCIALFALPNGNTTEQTIGKILEPGDDWHYDIQHIGAQARFIREHVDDYNLVTVYLETDQKSWPAWKSAHSNHAALMQSLVDSIKNIFADFETFIVLTGHSGGGRFTFSFLDGVSEIPPLVKRISFLDSNYGYEDEYGAKIVAWLNSSNENFLSVIAYNDSVALYNGEPIVSPTGGTWYRSKMMQRYLANYYEFEKEEDDEFIKYYALDNRIEILLKKNPERKILHTVQVELNGFIQGMVSGTEFEGVDYEYYGERAYSEWIQQNIDEPHQLNIPPRNPDAMTGSEFMASVENLSFEEREERIYDEISNGNIPDFLRTLTKIKTDFSDASGVSHSVEYEVMPDYLAIGSDADFCRIPMGPITAQKLADLFGASMPTRKLVDHIYFNCEVKLEPVTYPWSEASTTVPKFVEHNSDIEELRIAAGGELGQLTGGTKKDVVISNKIVDPARPNSVVIYGWHKLDGTPWQPLYNGHVNWYVDYSHGIRFLNEQMLIDGELVNYRDLLTDETLYKILSDESGAMEQPSYLEVYGTPEKPKSFGLINDGSSQLKIIVKPDVNVKQYDVYLSTNGVSFGYPVSLSPDNLVIDNLDADKIYFVKLKAVNQIAESGFSEVLAATPSSNESKILVVNGFDRASEGNTFDFIRQHGAAFYLNDLQINSATNEAIVDGLFDLGDYEVVDYILGDESTADETFSFAEQVDVVHYLRDGGKLFVSGSEIAWDLDYKGNSTDKLFINDYLKMKYVADAPFNTQSQYYEVEITENNYFPNLTSFFFDDGTHGTFNVKWPDVVMPNSGGSGFLKYSELDVSAGYAGVMYSGIFREGSADGKVLSLGFPFETIYPQDTRVEFMKGILQFFFEPTDIDNNLSSSIPTEFKLYQNYPNPFNPTTTIQYSIPFAGRSATSPYNIRLTIFDILGNEIAVLVNQNKTPGNYSAEFNAKNLASGTYFYKLSAGEFTDVKKMILVK